MKKILTIMGAGPKAMAIAAKAAALKFFGYKVPEIWIIEKNEVGANWSGSNGHTDGEQQLGTPPLKDVGFPYMINFSSRVVKYMMEQFSWIAFMHSGEQEWMKYGDWVDRGQPQPTHRIWHLYLKWILEKLISNGDVKYVHAEVAKLQVGDGRWQITCQAPDGSIQVIESDGLVISGPGNFHPIKGQVEHPRIMDGKTFWSNLEKFDGLHGDEDENAICVVGSGETAATVITEILSRVDTSNPPPLWVINRKGLIESRGEGYSENSLFTDPDGFNWTELNPEERDQIIKRTDRGVFSQASLTIINQSRIVRCKRGRVVEINVDEPEGTIRLVLSTDQKGDVLHEIPAGYVIVGAGFNPWSFTELFDDEYRSLLSANRLKTREVLASLIARDLSINWEMVSSKFETVRQPKLYLPMLSGLAQGPGFPNLSSLGTLSDRILGGYLISATAKEKIF